MKLLVCHPGASWSTADVHAGLRYGLERHGVEIIDYALDGRISYAGSTLHALARKKRKEFPNFPKPTRADVIYQASTGALERALRHRVDAVVVVSAMYFHPDVMIMLREAKKPVCVLFTESPYDLEQELKVAAIVDGCWTCERSVVSEFLKVNPRSAYLPHGWHPARHRPDHAINSNARAHDVVFVGSGFRERVAWLKSVNWTGIDLGLYGVWDSVPKNDPICRYMPLGNDAPITNDLAVSLYRNAKIGLNLYRQSKGFGPNAPFIDHAESINPRGYELAACGAFHISEYRQEVAETFGENVPTFRTTHEAETLIRRYLDDENERQRLARNLPACVAESSWVERAACVIGDLQLLLDAQRAANVPHAAQSAEVG